MRTKVLVCACILALACVPAFANNIITNGGFESGFSGWTVTNGAGSGSWYVTGAATTPISSHPTPGPAGGSNYAVSDQTGPGSHSLTQNFTLAGGAATLSFDMFVNDWNGGPYCSNGSDAGATSSPVECAWVNILDSNSGALITNLFTQSTDTNGNPWSHYSYDLSGLGAGTFTLQFLEADNQLYENMGVDNVNLSTVPEPGSLVLFGSGLAGLAGLLRKRRQA